MNGLLLQIAAIGLAGIGAQWLAWRWRVPAIALLLIAGFIIGPVTGFVIPSQSFGTLYKPMIAMAVAIILFEGGLTLNFHEIKETSSGLKRIIFIGGPLVWLFSTLAAHFVAGLSWPTASVLGAIFVITGPTVIMPLLRQAQLAQRPASLLRWEAIVNDPIGALYAVLAFEIYLVLHGQHEASNLAVTIIAAALLAIVGGYVLGKLIAVVFLRALAPEFLKAPIILVSVLASYALSDLVLEESGLLTVTILGITLANQRLASLSEMRRFKETITVLLVSGLFIMLTASFDLQLLSSLGWSAVLFVGCILFVTRPLAIMISTIGSGLSMKERVLVSWIAPRGIVAVAVSGLFGSALADHGVADGHQMTALAFLVVTTTILFHGFSLGPLAKLLGLKSAEKPGILIAGANTWTIAFAEKLNQMEVPVLLTDTSWNRLRTARLANIPVHFGEILSEEAHHKIALNRFSHLVAASDNDAYNALICSEFGPELGRSHVYQISGQPEQADRNALNFTIGGRPLFKSKHDLTGLRQLCWKDWEFHATTLTEQFTYDEYLTSRTSDTVIIAWVNTSGHATFASGLHSDKPGQGDTLLSFGPPLNS